MKILSIDTSCDETSVAVTDGNKILSNVVSSQIAIHKEWGGVVPALAKKAHQDNIDVVVAEALVVPWEDIGAIAVTQGPGLSVALQVGIAKAKELATKYNKKLIAVNHLNGHIYSCFAQKDDRKIQFNFPYLVLIVSGGHTSLVLFKNHLDCEVIGETLDDAAGEALDKAIKMLGLGYPGGALVEKLAKTGDKNYHKFPRPMRASKDLNFSFAGLKTSLYYFLKTLTPEEIQKNLNNICASYQAAIFDTLQIKLKKAMDQTGVKNILLVGGVSANETLRNNLSELVKINNGEILFPADKTLYGDNAAMIGIAANYYAQQNKFVENFEELIRIPRMEL
jgi:N6-L-threonylcarbamoyladenine synthase